MEVIEEAYLPPLRIPPPNISAFGLLSKGPFTMGTFEYTSFYLEAGVGACGALEHNTDRCAFRRWDLGGR